MKPIMMMGLAFVAWIQTAAAAPSTLEVKKQGEHDIKQVIEPIAEKYCRDQCRIVHIETEVDLAVDDLTTPGFEDGGGKVSLAPASGKVKLLIDENLGNKNRTMIIDMMKEHLLSLNFPVELESKVTRFPQPASTNFKSAELRDKVARDIKNSINGLLTQFCSKHCVLGEFDVQTESVNPEDIDYASSQEYFQDGPAAVRVKSVKANIMVDEVMPAAEAAGIVEMAKLKLAQFKNAEVLSQSMKFPKSAEELSNMIASLDPNANGRFPSSTKTDQRETRDMKDSKDSKELKELKDSKESKTENITKSETGNKSERFEKYEKI